MVETAESTPSWRKAQLIELLITPIGIWMALVAVASLLFISGLIDGYFRNSLRGERIVAASGLAVLALTTIGLIPALYFSGMAEMAVILLVIAGGSIAIVGSFLFLVGDA